jgi:hypothetical protein
MEKGMIQKLGKPDVGSQRTITRTEHDLVKKVTILITKKSFVYNDWGKIVFLTKEKFPIQLNEKADKYITETLEAFWAK